MIVKPRSETLLNYFSFSYWVDSKINNSELNSNSTSTTDNVDDLYSNVPDILLNYKAYLNNMTEKVFWIILYYCIALVSFMGGVTLIACLYRYIGEPYIDPFVNKNFRH